MGASGPVPDRHSTCADRVDFTPMLPLRPLIRTSRSQCQVRVFFQPGHYHWKNTGMKNHGCQQGRSAASPDIPPTLLRLLASGRYGLSGYRLLYSFCKRCTLVILASKQRHLTRVPPCFFGRPTGYPDRLKTDQRVITSFACLFKLTKSAVHSRPQSVITTQCSSSHEGTIGDGLKVWA